MFEKKLVNLIILCLSSIFAFFFDGKCFASTTISEDKSGYQKQSPPDKEKDNNIKKSEEEKKSQEEEKTAETHFMRGVDFFQDGMISAALAEFLMSYKKAPKWEVLYNIGICYYRLGRYDEALKTLEKYIKDGAENIPEERKSVVEKLRIKMGSSYGSIAFTGKKKNVQIVIDSKYKVVTPVNKPIEIPAGLHTLNIFLEGYYPVIKEISVAAGQTTTVPIELEPSPPIKELIEKKKFYNTLK